MGFILATTIESFDANAFGNALLNTFPTATAVSVATTAAVALVTPAAASSEVGAGLSVHECARAVCPLHTVTATEEQPTWATPSAPSAGAVSVGMLLAAMAVSAAAGTLVGGGLVAFAATRRREKVAAVEGGAAWPLAESSTRANHDYHAFA